ncbi:hypothetical protein AMAG_03995 [Allomyces macrogynus ATCC 38327]|uniref:HECT-type E3 ubiquitin transferase n=1 Tax=Allomyces macrogynus (strain ATCC 38327) TaxID=578462 RepID=A0A0L0S7C8_ALLM3|nr:hypothetical protein AMAG_03995 [Allomyces macrogynus ATCC 38327]|eukprot:KNE58422.1 hypothetical protein AMAG_03995 [Allomyces macrogynus ATCC 38327]
MSPDLGREVGLAISHSFFLDAPFVGTFYKAILKHQITVKDMESFNVDYYEPLNWILENDIPSKRRLTMSTSLSECEMIDLQMEEQLNAFQQGLLELVPETVISAFEEHKLELLINGIAEFDVVWAKLSVYLVYKESDPVIAWFWQCVRTWDNEKRARLLQFATGTSRIPSTGFQDLEAIDGPCMLAIHRAQVDIQALPKALANNVNCIDLPPYHRMRCSRRSS